MAMASSPDKEFGMNSQQTRINRGRWSSSENHRFDRGYESHGSNWAEVAKVVRTRTPSQVRSHAQKVFYKQEQDRLKIGKNANLIPEEFMNSIGINTRRKSRTTRDGLHASSSNNSDLSENSSRSNEEISQNRIENISHSFPSVSSRRNKKASLSNSFLVENPTSEREIISESRILKNEKLDQRFSLKQGIQSSPKQLFTSADITPFLNDENFQQKAKAYQTLCKLRSHQSGGKDNFISEDSLFAHIISPFVGSDGVQFCQYGLAQMINFPLSIFYQVEQPNQRNTQIKSSAFEKYKPMDPK